MKKEISVAVDGPASSGKSTVSKKIAEMFNFIYIDTGAMYRALTYGVLKNNIDVNDELLIHQFLVDNPITFQKNNGLQLVFLGDEEVTSHLRSDKVNENVSDVSKHAKVRDIMVKQQQDLANNASVIMDGRDIGTVVLPDADIKIYLEASIEERAKRRYLENKEKNDEIELDDIRRSLEKRDYTDMSRVVSPLKKAEDALVIDTTECTREEIIDKVKNIIKQRISS